MRRRRRRFVVRHGSSRHRVRPLSEGHTRRRWLWRQAVVALLLLLASEPAWAIRNTIIEQCREQIRHLTAVVFDVPPTSAMPRPPVAASRSQSALPASVPARAGALVRLPATTAPSGRLATGSGAGRASLSNTLRSPGEGCRLPELAVAHSSSVGQSTAAAAGLQPQAAGQTLYVDATDPGVSGEVYIGSSYSVPATGDAYTNVYAGYNGTGTITHSSGGTLTLSGSLYLGDNTGSNGTYALSGPGTLSAAEEFIGSSGAGTFTQSAGTNTLTGTYGELVLGYNTGGSGTYALSGTGTLSAPSEIIGSSSSGTFTQTGGTNTLTGTHGSLEVGSDYNSNGSYTLSGTGVLSADSEIVGYAASGTFTQSGGTNTVGNTLNVGAYHSGSGTYSLSGTGVLSADSECLGYNSGSSGTFTQNGGTNTVGSGGLTFAALPYSSGTYNLNGGTLQAGYVIQSQGTGTFNFNGGTLQANASSAYLGSLSAANVLAGGARIDSNGDTITIAQALLTGTAAGSPDGGLIKMGAGTLILTGANTYTGGTTVSAGTLLANNANGSATGTGAVQVQGGGTLGGSGTVAGMLTVASGGALAPGSGAPGRLTLASSLALNSGSTLAIELGGLPRARSMINWQWPVP